MDSRLLKEVLAAHADQMVKGNRPSQDLLDLFSEDEELAPLLDVAERVKSTLKATRPSSTFEDSLRRDLMAAAHLRRAGGYPTRRKLHHDLRFSSLALALLALVFSILIAHRRAGRRQLYA